MVFDRVLLRMRELIRTSGYVMTVHAIDEMETDGLTVFDIERCILTGQIVERQKDLRTGEWKYLVYGQTVGGADAVTVAKIGPAGSPGDHHRLPPLEEARSHGL